jgi:hypothetical protein
MQNDGRTRLIEHHNALCFAMQQFLAAKNVAMFPPPFLLARFASGDIGDISFSCE